MTNMNSEFWGMTAFFITTVIFSITTLIYRLKLNRAQQLIRQLKEKSNQFQSHGCERQYKK